jgi:hypothetical protein
MTNIERRVGAPDTRPLPHVERRVGAPDTRESEKPKLACFRVNYFRGGQPATAYVVAVSEGHAAAFMGVTDGSAQVNRVAYPVEVVGLDPAHAPLVPMPINVAPFELPKNVSRDEFNALQAQLADMQKQLAAKNAPAK